MYGVCTQSSNHGCLREGKYGMLNPVMSGRIKSKTTIRYGRVEIVAKAPRGDWLWPGEFNWVTLAYTRISSLPIFFQFNFRYIAHERVLLTMK